MNDKEKYFHFEISLNQNHRQIRWQRRITSYSLQIVFDLSRHSNSLQPVKFVKFNVHDNRIIRWPRGGKGARTLQDKIAFRLYIHLYVISITMN